MIHVKTTMNLLVFFLNAALIKTVYVDSSRRKEWSCDNKIADIVFLLDTSTSIREEDFDKQVVFVEHIVNSLPVGETGVHVAVSTFGSDVATHLYLNSHFNKNNLLDDIRSIRYRGGKTDTGRAIKHARKILFSEKHGGRNGVEQVLIVITDGYSTDSLETLTEASMCRSLGIKLISIGVGFGADKFELKNIASTHNGEKMIFTVDNFDSLYNIEDVITTTTCDVIRSDDSVMADTAVQEIPTVSEVRKYCGGKPADVYFLVDSSSSVRTADYRKMLEFVTDVINLFDPRQTRVGVVAFSDGIHPVISLDNDFQEDTLKQRVKSIEHYKGGTRTGSALQYLRKQGFKRGYARKNVAHVVILLTDGFSADATLTIKESKILKQMGTYIFSVGIGDQVDELELQEISSQPRDNFVFLMEDFHVLSAIKNVLAIKTCLGITQIFPANNKTGLQADEEFTVCVPDKPVDVLYVYDGQFLSKEHSGSIQDFVSDIIISTKDSEIQSGIVTAACRRSTGVPLAAYKDLSEIKPLLEQSQAEGIADLLRHVRLQGFSEQNGARLGAVKKVVLFIEGEIKDVQLKMQLAVKRLKFRSEIDLIIVFIGKEPGKVVMSLNDDQIIQTDSIHTVHTVKRPLLEKLCGA